jgi:D-alanine-D-alanine ligase
MQLEMTAVAVSEPEPEPEPDPEPEPNPEPANGPEQPQVQSRPLRVAIAYNLKKGVKSEAADSEAEYDSIETVLAIKKALEGPNCQVELCEADGTLPQSLKNACADIVFNIAEGLRGKGREAAVPALLNLLNIPYTGSDETTLCLALDKALTKRLLSTYRVRSPKSHVLAKSRPKARGKIPFPAIVKPNAEGSSKGISDVSVVCGREELENLVSRNLSLYGQDMLVEEYIAGREFTVGVLGNGADAVVFAPMEIVYLREEEAYPIYSYNVKQNYKTLIRYECPANLDPKLDAQLRRTARKIYEALECRDFARMDFRLSPDGKAYFIEINPLPGLAPGYSDYPMLAEFCGVPYRELVRGILQSALVRHGLDKTFGGWDR